MEFLRSERKVSTSPASAEISYCGESLVRIYGTKEAPKILLNLS